LAANKRLLVLKKTTDFQKIQKNGLKIKPVSWLIFNFLGNELLQFRCGWTISRKVGNAVVRNKLKRWSRVFFRESLKRNALADIPLDLNLVFLQRDAGFYRNLKYREFEFIMNKGMAQIAKKIPTNNKTNIKNSQIKKPEEELRAEKLSNQNE
jgi:ribonuclease P protein component